VSAGGSAARTHPIPPFIELLLVFFQKSTAVHYISLAGINPIYHEIDVKNALKYSLKL
jgi:hypothetical protein